MGIEIITLPVESWEAYRSLRLRALKEDPAAFSSSYATARAQPDEFWRTRLRTALEGRDQWLLFAREGEELVGMIGAFIPEGSSDLAVVVSVYVPSEARGKGVSSLLMEAILETLSRRPELRLARLGVNVTQLAAIGLYRKFGFEEVSRAPSLTGEGKLVDQIEMERRLQPD